MSSITELEAALRSDSNLAYLAGGTAMNTRKFHALSSCVLFLVLAALFGVLSGKSVDLWRVAFWSIVGVATYIVWCGVFGFDPHRTRIAATEPALTHYIDRWELRLGQATLCMLGGVAVAAQLVDPAKFVTAVVSGTMAAWTYFVVRLYAGGYRQPTVARS